MIHTPNPEGDGVDRPSQSAMAEVLGQKSLLGFGVVLAWLVLFHLLVNIWLLCVFTSLLVVLGGWLGSQAVLESNSVVHLERFIKLEQVLYIYSWDCLLQIKKKKASCAARCPQLLHCVIYICFATAEFQAPPSADDERYLDEEIHNTVEKIIRDFVTSWYSTVSSERGFEKEVEEAMISMAMELKIRARQVDRKVC